MQYSAGSNGEQLRFVLTNTGTTANPAYYLSEWNSSRIWVFTYPPGLGPTLYNMSTVTAANQLPGQTIGAPGNLAQYGTISLPITGTRR